MCAGHVNVAPRHLTAEAETLLSATLIHEVSFVYVYKGIEIGNMGGYVSSYVILFRLYMFLVSILMPSLILEMKGEDVVIR